MATNTFLSNDNAQMLWEVIIDNDTIAQNNQTQQIFTQVFPEFYEREKTNHKNLMEMNKNFISLMMNLLKTKINQQQQQQQQQQSNQSSNQYNKPKITFEELQEERVSIFEQELNAKQQEFSSAMALPLPPTPTFSDNKKDEPLTEMEEIIRRTIAERNLEMEKIHSLNNKKEAENWIKGTSTSLKDENERNKQNALNIHQHQQNNQNSVKAVQQNQSDQNFPKLINIGNEVKHISWSEPIIDINNEPVSVQTPNYDHPVQTSLFAKLKPKDPMKILEDLINTRFDRLEALLEKTLLEKVFKTSANNDENDENDEN